MAVFYRVCFLARKKGDMKKNTIFLQMSANTANLTKQNKYSISKKNFYSIKKKLTPFILIYI